MLDERRQLRVVAGHEHPDPALDREPLGGVVDHRREQIPVRGIDEDPRIAESLLEGDQADDAARPLPDADAAQRRGVEEG